MKREFEIGDVVEIGSENQLAMVVGVIHKSARLFVWFQDGNEEKEFEFGAVVKQWREVTPNADGNATERSEGRVDHNVGLLTPGKD